MAQRAIRITLSLVLQRGAPPCDGLPLSDATPMAIRNLPRAEWNDYFDTFSSTKHDTGRIDYAEIRMLSPEDGAQPQTRWLPLQGIVYDPKDDLLEIIVTGLDHLVGHPETIYVDETDGRLNRFEIVRHDGIQELIEIR